MNDGLLQCSKSDQQPKSGEFITVEKFSALLLDLHRASRSLTTNEFQAHALERIKQQVPFDTATWLMATDLENGGHCVHDTYFYGLPDGTAELMNLTSEGNIIAQTCRETPGRCFYFPAHVVLGNPPTAIMARHMGITQVLCIAQRSSVPELLISISLGRRSSSRCFTEGNRLLLQALAPHLADMLQISHVAQIATIRASKTDQRSAMAVIDELGMLIAAEPGFSALLHTEWPAWRGPYLPAALRKTDWANRKQFSGKKIAIRFDRVGPATLVTIAERTPSDTLSPRERLIAERFAGGESYKEVARRLGVSPATVRHHLRVVYRKLGVGDKGALSNLIANHRLLQEPRT